MRQIEAQQKLLHPKAAIHQIYFERAFAQHAIAILELLGRNDFYVVAFVAEEIAEQLVLAVPGMIDSAEFNYGDIGLLGPAELPVRFEKRVQQVLAAAGLGQRIL